MIRSRSLQERDVADIANSKKCTVTEVRAKIRAFGAPCTPEATGERRSRILPYVLDVLLSRFLAKPDLYLDETAEFMWNEFGLSISTDSVRTLEGPTRIRLLRYNSRTMAASWYRHLWTKKPSRGIRRERDGLKLLI
jgi:hypothetical protein